MVRLLSAFPTFLMFSAILWSPTIVRAQLVVNEIMVNEPGGATNLEWIELFVDGAASVVLDDYQLMVDGELVTVPGGRRIEAQSYLIICKKLVSSDGAASFENRWGDASGIWGDTPDEAAMALPPEASFSLVNTGGTVSLHRQGDMVSTMAWADAGADGYSWERVNPSSPSTAQSVDFDGSTPGVVNSVTPVGYDRELEGVDVAIDRGWTQVRFTVVNRGLQTVGETLLSLYYDETWHQNSDTPLEQFDIPALEPGEACEVGDDFLFDSMYVHLRAALPDDDRSRNNQRFFAAPAGEFPAFHLTELSPRPGGSSEAEWIEILNRTDQMFDLADWRVGDYKRTNAISDTSLMVAPGARIVLTRARSLFMDRYPDAPGVILELDSWSLLNDGGDTVLLIDHFGLEADRFGYSSLFGGDHTWCRDESDGQNGQWGRSEESGGLPGDRNRTVLATDSEELNLSIEPALFSPDGDGIEDSVVITIGGPDGQDYELRIFDRQGRVVRQFDQSGYRRDQYVWHGLSDAGRRLPIGIYILYCEIGGSGSIKKTIVIAR